jgi:large subunit ribosomal protein L9
MLVILKEDVHGLGKQNDVVNVEQDYAETYLFPNWLATKAMSQQEAMDELDDGRSVHQMWTHRFHDQASDVADRLANTLILITLDSPAAAVTSRDIANAVKRETGFILDARRIDLDEPITKPGDYTVPVSLHHDLEFVLTVRVE